MGISLKNKASSQFALISNTILLLLVICISTFWLIVPQLMSKLTENGQILLELDKNVSESEIKTINEKILSLDFIDTNKITFITKNQALGMMTAEVSAEMSSRLEKENPFRDLFNLQIKENYELQESVLEIKEELQFSTGIAGIYSNENVSNSSSSQVVNYYSNSISIPALLLISILSIFYFVLHVKNLVTENTNMVNSIYAYGSTTTYIKRIFVSDAFKKLFVAWIIAVVLFLALFYRFLSNLDSDITDISILRLSLILFMPFILAFIIQVVLINYNVGKTLKTK